MVLLGHNMQMLFDIAAFPFFFGTNFPVLKNVVLVVTFQNAYNKITVTVTVNLK